MLFNRIDIPDGLVPANRRFFNRATNRHFSAQARDEVTEIDLYDEIGMWGVSASDIRRALRGAGDVRLRIHSPGGDVFDGITMYNDLVDHAGRVEVQIAGLAASAASIVAMAGDTITIAENGFFMVHNVWGITIGNRHDHLSMAEIMEKLDNSLAQTYAKRTGIGQKEIAQMMDDEKWLTAEESVDKGFADATGERVDAKTRYDLSAFSDAPKQWSLPKKSTKIESVRDLEAHLRDAGLSRNQARTWASKAFDEAQREAEPGQRDAGLFGELIGVHLDNLRGQFL